jgi:hypothetical protein
MGPRSASVIPSVEHLVTQALYRLRRLGDRVLADSGLRTWHFGVMPALDLYGPCRSRSWRGAVTHRTDDRPARRGAGNGGPGDARPGFYDRRRNAAELTDLGRGRIAPLLGAMRQVDADVSTTLGFDGRQELHSS